MCKSRIKFLRCKKSKRKYSSFGLGLSCSKERKRKKKIKDKKGSIIYSVQEPEKIFKSIKHTKLALEGCGKIITGLMKGMRCQCST